MTTTTTNAPISSAPSDRAPPASKKPGEKLSLLERAFPENMHDVERVIRFILGLALVTMVVVGPQTNWGFLGLVLIFTAAQGSCPIYTIFGFSTCKSKH